MAMGTHSDLSESCMPRYCAARHVVLAVEGQGEHMRAPTGARKRTSVVEVDRRDREPGSPPKAGRSSFRCLLCGELTLTQDYLRRQGTDHKLGIQLLAIAAQRDRQRVYLPADEKAEVSHSGGAAADNP